MLTTLRTAFFTSSSTKFIFLRIKFPVNSFCSLSESRRVKSERVSSFLKASGLTESQITRIAQFRPRLLFADPKKTLAPKIDFLRSIGISNTDLPNFLAAKPKLLIVSLENQLIPCHRYLKSLLISDENVSKLLKRNFGILVHSVDRVLAPNISLLGEIGVLKSNIMLMRDTRAVELNHSELKSKVEELVSFGLNPTRLAFLVGLNVLCALKKTTFDRKWAAFRKWNLSDKEVQMAFRSQPLCMSLSEEKIAKGMDVFVNKMGFEAARIARTPGVLCYSLENRTIPRCRVIQILIARGILKSDIGFSTFLSPSETGFLKKFVSNNEDKVPGLLKIYEGKMETGIGSDNIDVIN